MGEFIAPIELAPPAQQTYSDTSNHTGEAAVFGAWFPIDTVITTITIDNDTGDGGYAGASLPGGTWLPGKISQIELTSGLVILYKNP